jgi:hypothetical protein
MAFTTNLHGRSGCKDVIDLSMDLAVVWGDGNELRFNRDVL